MESYSEDPLYIRFVNGLYLLALDETTLTDAHFAYLKRLLLKILEQVRHSLTVEVYLSSSLIEKNTRVDFYRLLLGSLYNLLEPEHSSNFPLIQVDFTLP